MNTEYTVNQILKDIAANADTSDYTERELNSNGSGVTCYCAVTSQVFGTLYPRYTITWKTSLEGDKIQAAFHFNAPEVGTSYTRVAHIGYNDEYTHVKSKIYSALVSGLKRGKAIYDGTNTGPWHEDYQHDTNPPEEG